jgi:hypothetical protein
MEQTNVTRFPAQAPEAERVRLYHDDPAIVLVLARGPRMRAGSAAALTRYERAGLSPSLHRGDPVANFSNPPPVL